MKFFILSNSAYNTSIKGAIVKILINSNKYTKLCQQGYTSCMENFSTNEIDNKKFKITQDGKDILSKSGRTRTIKSDSKNYENINAKYTLIKIPNTHVTVFDKLTNSTISNSKGLRKFKIGSSVLTNFLNMGVLHKIVAEPMHEVQPVVVAEPMPEVQPVVVAEPMPEVQQQREVDVKVDRKDFHEIPITSDMEKLRYINKCCYQAFRRKLDLITFRMTENNERFSFYSLQIHPLLENNQWNAKKAHQRLNYFMKYPHYYKNQWISKEAQNYMENKRIGAVQDALEDSEWYANMTVDYVMEMDFEDNLEDIMREDPNWDESLFEMMFAEPQSDMGINFADFDEDYI